MSEKNNDNEPINLPPQTSDEWGNLSETRKLAEDLLGKKERGEISPEDYDEEVESLNQMYETDVAERDEALSDSSSTKSNPINLPPGNDPNSSGDNSPTSPTPPRIDPSGVLVTPHEAQQANESGNPINGAYEKGGRRA